jgi:hypothetical protein
MPHWHHISMAFETLNVSGMTCGCSRARGKALGTPGVTKATVDLVNASASWNTMRMWCSGGRPRGPAARPQVPA